MKRNLLSSMIVGTLLIAGAALAAGKDGSTAPKTDADVAKSVRHEILMYPHAHCCWDNVEFKVTNGNVELDGAVSQPYKKSDLQNIIKRLPGVAAVTNDLKVLPLSSFRRNDRLRVQNCARDLL